MVVLGVFFGVAFKQGGVGEGHLAEMVEVLVGVVGGVGVYFGVEN